MDPCNIDVPVLANQQELIYISSVWTQDIIWKTCQEKWMIRTDGEKERVRKICAISTMMIIYIYLIYFASCSDHTY